MPRKEFVEGLMESFMQEPVKVLFEFDGTSETVEIVGRLIPVKSAILTILSKVADYDEVPLVALIEEFLVVAQAVQQNSVEEMLRYLDI